MAETESPSDIVPGTVFTPRQVRILKVVVIAMGVLLVGGFVLVISVIIYQASSIGESAEPAKAVIRQAGPEAALAGLTLPDGMSISNMALDGDRLAVHLSGPEGAEIRIIDLVTGSVISTIRVKGE